MSGLTCWLHAAIANICVVTSNLRYVWFVTVEMGSTGTEYRLGTFNDVSADTYDEKSAVETSCLQPYCLLNCNSTSLQQNTACLELYLPQSSAGLSIVYQIRGHAIIRSNHIFRNFYKEPQRAIMGLNLLLEVSPHVPGLAGLLGDDSQRSISQCISS